MRHKPRHFLLLRISLNSGAPHNATGGNAQVYGTKGFTATARRPEPCQKRKARPPRRLNGLLSIPLLDF